MDIQIFQYKESHLEDIRVILNEYLSFISKELIKPPWNFTLDVGEFTSMHTHPSDYYFVANQPSQLEVYDENCNVLFDFTAAGTMGFKASGDELIPIGVELPWKVPVTHAAKNIGDTVYNEFLFELKGVGQNHPKEL